MRHTPDRNRIVLAAVFDSVEDICSKSRSLFELYHQPSNVSADAQGDRIHFHLDEKNPNYPIGMGSGIGVYKNGTVAGTVMVNVDNNLPLYQQLLPTIDEKARVLNELRKEWQTFQGYQDRRPAPDPIHQRSLDKTAQLIEKRQAQLTQNGNFNNITEQEGRALVRFMVGHELAHTSFKEQFYLQFDLMDGVKVPKNLADKTLLNNALMTLNQHAEGKYSGITKTQTATYMAMRNEMHSDIAGVVLASHLAYRELVNKGLQNDPKAFNEAFAPVRAVADHMRRLREDSTNSMDLSQSVIYGTELVFKNPQLEKAIAIGIQSAKDPQYDAHKEVMKLTENTFIKTIKTHGLNFKYPTHKVDNTYPHKEKTVSLESDYVEMSENGNTLSRREFTNCQATSTIKNSCLSQLTGAQRTAMDFDGDNKLERRDIDSALIEASQTGRLPKVKPSNKVADVEKQNAQLEAQALRVFVQENRIPVSANNMISAPFWDLNGKNIKLKMD